MEDIEKVKTNIKDYVKKHFKIDSKHSQNLVSMDIRKLDGLSNINYHVIISNNTTNEILSQIVYRKFGEISEVVDRDLESMIIKNLADKGIGPKIYERDPKKQYRIDEFLVNTIPIPNDLKFEPEILEQVIRICVSYSLISNVLQYKTVYDSEKERFAIALSLLTGKTQDRDSSLNHHKRIKHNIFDQCMKDMYDKAINGWELFSNEFKAKIPEEGNESEYEKFFKFEQYMANFHEIYRKVFPSHGLLILNHNDVHRLNLIINRTTSKMYILDHEYASLNQIGNDIANFMNESVFNYSPDYYFKPELIDFDFFYEAYLKFLQVFHKEHEYIFNEMNGHELYETIKTKKYYVNLHCCLNLFWLLYCGIYLNFSDYIDSKGFSYFQHGMDRIEFYERALKEIGKEEN